jgi:hypothetical protein
MTKPLFHGGQGRTPQDTQDSANTLVWLMGLGFVLILILVCAG